MEQPEGEIHKFQENLSYSLITFWNASCPSDYEDTVEQKQTISKTYTAPNIGWKFWKF